MHRPSPMTPLAAALVFVLAALLAGCGTSASSSPPAVSSSAPASVAPSPTAVASPTAEPTPEPTATPAPVATETPEPEPTRSPQYESPEDLEVGDCYDPIEDPDDDALLAAIILPCSAPHLAEVFGLAEVAGADGAPFPGFDDLEAEAEDLCDAAFEEYVGIDFNRSRYGYVYYTPTEATWAGGDRAVMCVIDDNGRTIEGSVEGTRR
jgi:hypothetical protein